MTEFVGLRYYNFKFEIMAFAIGKVLLLLAMRPLIYSH